MTRILISAYTGLGNFILKTPLIEIIKKYFPDCKIDIIAGNGYGTEFVLKNSSLINKTYILKEDDPILKKIVFFINLRKNKYDVVLLPFDSNRRFLFFGSYLAKVKLRLVHVNLRDLTKVAFFSLMPNTRTVPVLPGRHEIDLNYDLLEAYIQRPIERKYETFFNTSNNNDAVLKKFQLKKKHYIILQIGAANGASSAKKWKSENFACLIRRLADEYPEYKVVTVGDKGDYQNDIKQLELQGLPFVNTAGLTTIEEVANLLYHSTVVVAHDSGIMHMSNALKCHLIALYGPTDYTRTRPLGLNSVILYSKTDCFCKMYNFQGNERELLELYPNCMDGITVNDVYDEVKKVIGCEE